MSHFHCVKGVRIQSYSGPHFSHIFPHLDWIRKDTQIIQKIILNSIKRTVKFSIFNLYYGFPVTTSRSMMEYHCLFQCGVNDNSTEEMALALRDGSNSKQKLNMYLKARTGRKQLKDWTSIKDFTSHYDLSDHFSNLGRKRRKKC